MSDYKLDLVDKSLRAFLYDRGVALVQYFGNFF